MKSSLLCLILALELEEHNLLELVGAYQKFGSEMSEQHLHYIIQRGLTLSLHRGGLPAVKEFWEGLQDKNIIADPVFLALADYAVETGELDEFLLTESQFRHRFLDHVCSRFGPKKLLPSIEIADFGALFARVVF